jgi:F420H(2)-dependent quinone reductase
VRLQDGATVKEFAAREVSGDEKQHYWTVAERFWPPFPEYRRLGDIPIMVLEPIAPHQGGAATGTAAP